MSPYPGAYLAGLGQAPIAAQFFEQKVPMTTFSLWDVTKVVGALFAIGWAWKHLLGKK